MSSMGRYSKLEPCNGLEGFNDQGIRQKKKWCKASNEI